MMGRRKLSSSNSSVQGIAMDKSDSFESHDGLGLYGPSAPSPGSISSAHDDHCAHAPTTTATATATATHRPRFTPQNSAEDFESGGCECETHGETARAVALPERHHRKGAPAGGGRPVRLNFIGVRLLCSTKKG
jgi:hypothetical protein